MMQTNERTLDSRLEDRLGRLGEHLDAERQAHHDLVIDESASGADHNAGRDLARYRWLAVAAMIVAAVAAATLFTLNRGPAASPASTATTVTEPSDNSATIPTAVDYCRQPYGPVSTPCIYEVQSGDSPMSIAQGFGVSVNAFFDVNPGIGSAIPFLIGTEVLIPAAD